MADDGKIEIIGCKCFLDTDNPLAAKFQRDLEAIFGKGNVIGYSKSMIWSTEGDAITTEELKRRQSGPVGRFLDRLLDVLGNSVPLEGSSPGW